MKIPCATPAVACPVGTDGDAALLTNASVETPDVRMFFANQFALRSSRFCEAVTQVAADLCALNPPEHFDSDVIFSSGEQTCIVDCSGSPVSYTVPSGAALGFTQAQADAAAYALACTFAAIVCAGGTPDPVPNEAQACSVVCQDGSVVTFTVPAGAVLGASLSEANATAYATACQAAALQCPDVPPPPLFGNSMVSSTSLCPSISGSFTYVVPANTFFAASLAEANATAQSYADQQAVLQRECMESIQTAICRGSDYDQFIYIGSHSASEFTWSVTSGSLPPTFTMNAGEVSGSASVAGVYTFTVQAVNNSTGNTTVRTFTIGIIDITTATPLTSGGMGTPYSLALAQSGIPSTAVWSVVSGALPAGLSMSSAGVISGTPTTVGNSAFSVAVTDSSSGVQCSKDFTMAVVLNPMDWWKLDEAANNPRIGSVNSVSLTCSASASSVAGGKYGNATSLTSQGTPANISCTVGNSGAPVTPLAYAGNGIDAFVWIKNPSGINANTIFELKFTDSAGTLIWSMSFTFHTTVGITYTLFPGGTSGNQVLAGSAAYRFFELWYDPVTKFIGIRVNDGAVLDVSSNPYPFAQATAAKGSISLTYDRIQAGSSADEVCEMAVYPAVLTAPQRAAIYNAGAGVTWPVVLP